MGPRVKDGTEINWKGTTMASRDKSELVQVSFRTREPLRAALESAAKARGVSMNTEMNERLMRSFEDDVKLEVEFSRVQLYAILRLVANAMDHAGASSAIMSNMGTGASKNWTDNPFAYDQALKAALFILNTFRPAGEIDVATPKSRQAREMGSETAKGIIEILVEEQPTVIGDVPIPSRARRDLGPLFDRLQIAE
jgi:hypothetical protein